MTEDERDGRAMVDALDLREAAGQEHLCQVHGNGSLIQVPDHAPPPKVVKAIAKTMQVLEVVAKSQKNTHGGYMFASTDDIYAALTRKMGEIGLICVALQEEWETKEGKISADGKQARSLQVSYSFMLAIDDEVWHHPQSKRTLLVPFTGPQTFQAAESYAKKQFLRSTFQIPTGDMDLDSMPDDMAGPIKLGGPPKPPTPAELDAERQKIQDMVAKRKEADGTPVMTAEQGEQAKAAIEDKVSENGTVEPPKEIDIYGQIEVASKFFEKAQNKKMLDSLYDRFVNTYKDHMHLVSADLEDMYKHNLERIESAAKK